MGTRFPAHTPFEVSGEELEKLKAQGAIVVESSYVEPLVPPADVEEVVEEVAEVPTFDIQALTKMTTSQLREFALEHDIDVPRSGIKADVFNAIVTALN